MTWLKLDDTLPTEPTMVSLSDSAWRLHITGLCYSSAHLTDGMLLEAPVRLMHPRAVKAAKELVEAGLWAKVDTGWQIVGYLDTQRSAAQVDAIKEQKRAAGKKGGEAKAAAKHGASGVPSEPPADDRGQLSDEGSTDDHDHPLNGAGSSSSIGDFTKHPQWPAIAEAGQICARQKVPQPKDFSGYATSAARGIAREQGWQIPELLRLRPDLEDTNRLAYVLATDGAGKAIQAAKDMAELGPVDFDSDDWLPADSITAGEAQ